jgi:hypothetical protein
MTKQQPNSKSHEQADSATAFDEVRRIRYHSDKAASTTMGNPSFATEFHLDQVARAKADQARKEE